MASEPPTEEQALRAAYQATRALLRVNDTASAQRVVLRLCEKVGARVVSADDEGATALPIDVAVDSVEPLLLAAESHEVEQLVARYVVPAVTDARLVARFAARREMLTTDATRDPLTGIWNRRSMELAINRAGPEDVVALVDLDHFKRVNDTYGHAVGDEVLTRFAAFLRNGLRGSDTVGRLGGEEFVVLFAATPLKGAAHKLEILRAQWADEAPHGTTFSAGVSAVPTAAECGREPPGQVALGLADALMYQAKSRGRNMIEVEQIADA